MHWLSKDNSDNLGAVWPWLLHVIPSRPVVIILVRPKISPFLRNNLSFPFSLLLIVFYVVDRLLSFYTYQLDPLTGTNLWQACLSEISSNRARVGPTLKVLIATSSKLPLISLNISQYLSAYTFTYSPSLIDMDSRESRGWGTLLHVMNREQNDWISFLKELMEFVLSPSNHLIGIGPKLDGNTLHNRGSS